MKALLITIGLVCICSLPGIGQNHFLDSSFATNGEFKSAINALSKDFSIPPYFYPSFANLNCTTSVYAAPHLFVLSKSLDTISSSWGPLVYFMGTEIICLDSNGILNTAFGNNGKLAISDSSQNAPHGNSILLQPDGKLLVFQDGQISRYLPNGQPDSAFGQNGHTILSVNAINGALQSNGKIVFHTPTAIYRLNSNGTVDSSFAGFIHPTVTDYNNGTLIIGINNQDEIFSFINRYRANPFANTIPVNFVHGFKTDANGNLDNSFQYADTTKSDLNIYTNVTFLPSGKMLVGNTFGKLIKLDEQGNMDPSFGNAGIFAFPRLPGAWSMGYNVFTSIVLQNNGKIQVGVNQQTGTVYRSNNNGGWGSHYSPPSASYFEYRFISFTIDSLGNYTADCGDDYFVTTKHERGVAETHNVINRTILVGSYNGSAGLGDAQFLSISKHVNKRPSSKQPVITALNSELKVSPGSALFYQWFDCATNEPIKGATDSIFSPAASGNYGITVYYEDGCATSNCFSFTIGNNELDLIEEVLVYPNPSNGFFNLDFNKPFEGTLELYNLSGQRVYQQDINGETKLEFYVQMPKGMYLLKLSSPDQNQTQRLIIQ